MNGFFVFFCYNVSVTVFYINNKTKWFMLGGGGWGWYWYFTKYQFLEVICMCLNHTLKCYFTVKNKFSKQ